jgi:imidazolonepropionase-like amidohydrolase
MTGFWSARIAAGLSMRAGLSMAAAMSMPMAATAMVGVWPARFLGQDAEFGTVEVGKLADLIVVPGDPLTDMGVRARPAVVVKGGEVVGR